MLLQYFGFHEEPFGATPDPRCLYPSHTHLEALASLEYGFHSNRGFTAMIAPPGMGKTTLLFRFLEIIRESASCVFLFDIDAECRPRDFVSYILRDLGITPGKSSSEMHGQLSDALVKEVRTGRKVVVVIDEAQNLSDALLERVRLLTNFETSRGKLMQIVLSGQPQLSDKLMQASLVQLRQRISTICRLEPLSAEETAAYIEYRLRQAGYAGAPLFTENALKLITEASQGIPRTINNLCFNALSLCRALKSKRVDDSMLAEVIADLQLIPHSRKHIASETEVAEEKPHKAEQRKQAVRVLKRGVFAVAALLVLSLLGILGLSEFRAIQSRKTGDERSVDQRAVPTTGHLPAPADTGEPPRIEPTQNTGPFEITVERDERLHDLAVQYLGRFDLNRLHQIQALNPKLTDPDHIEVGQRIRFPGPPPESAAKDTTHQAGERKLP